MTNELLSQSTITAALFATLVILTLLAIVQWGHNPRELKVLKWTAATLIAIYMIAIAISSITAFVIGNWGMGLIAGVCFFAPVATFIYSRIVDRQRQQK